MGPGKALADGIASLFGRGQMATSSHARLKPIKPIAKENEVSPPAGKPTATLPPTTPSYVAVPGFGVLRQGEPGPHPSWPESRVLALDADGTLNLAGVPVVHDHIRVRTEGGQIGWIEVKRNPVWQSR